MKNRQDGARTPRDTLEIRSRNEAVVDTQALANHTPSERSEPLQPAHTPQDYQPEPAGLIEPVPVEDAPSLPYEEPSNNQAPTPQHVDDGPEFYPRYDDDIFARTNFSPDKNKIVYNEKMPNNDIKYSPEKPQDPAAVYEQDAKNQLIAIETRVDGKNLKTQVLGEEKAMLDDLVNQEEAKRQEAKVRRDYRKRIDNYHINVTDNKFYDDKVMRVIKTRNKGPQIKEEQARVENEKMAETQFIKERKAAYKAELDKLAADRRRQRDSQRRTNFEAEQ
jgi:hypothetical protein